MKRKISSLVLLFILVASMFILAGCGEDESKNETYTDTTEEKIEVVEEKVELNSELEGVYAFATVEKDPSTVAVEETKIIALLEDGSEVDVTDYSYTYYNRFDYDGGKLYIRDDENFYEIDLTKGNGNYEMKTIEYEGSVKNKILACDEKIYFINSDNELLFYDLSTNNTEIVSKDEEVSDFCIDKENKAIYYVAETPQYYIKKYEIDSEETTIIAKNNHIYYDDSETYYGKTYIEGFSDGMLLYYEADENLNWYWYLYNVETNENEYLDNISDEFFEGIYSDGKIYYCAIIENESGTELQYPFKVVSDDKITTLIEDDENSSFGSIFDLGNGKIQAVSSQTYWIDKETFEIEEVDETFLYVHKIIDVENTK